MSATSNDPEKYFRTGIAMPLDRKPVFYERLNALGLKTIGDLITMFTLTDGIVEALGPVAVQFRQDLATAKADTGRRQDLLKKLKSMPVSELQNLMAKAGYTNPPTPVSKG